MNIDVRNRTSISSSPDNGQNEALDIKNLKTREYVESLVKGRVCLSNKRLYEELDLAGLVERARFRLSRECRVAGSAHWIE
jgi:hypothetical protein